MVAKGNAEITLDGGVREIPLEAAQGELFCKMREERTGEAEIALAIFQIAWVHLVGHRGGADFGRLCLLSKDAAADIEPHVLSEIEEDRINPAEDMAEFGKVIMGVDLSCLEERIQTELLNKFFTQFFPVHVWVRCLMRREVPHGSTEFAGHLEV